jgi:hypothetical protein
MEPLHWIPDNTASLLDVGCNAGELLYQCRLQRPHMQLAGIDINLMPKFIRDMVLNFRLRPAASNA